MHLKLWKAETEVQKIFVTWLVHVCIIGDRQSPPGTRLTVILAVVVVLDLLIDCSLLLPFLLAPRPLSKQDKDERGKLILYFLIYLLNFLVRN